MQLRLKLPKLMFLVLIPGQDWCHTVCRYSYPGVFPQCYPALILHFYLQYKSGYFASTPVHFFSPLLCLRSRQIAFTKTAAASPASCHRVKLNWTLKCYYMQFTLLTTLAHQHPPIILGNRNKLLYCKVPDSLFREPGARETTVVRRLLQALGR